MTDKRTKIEFLDSLFGSRKAFSMDNIIQRYESAFNKTLSRRSFFYYLKILKESGAPLSFRQEKSDFGKKTLYFYDSAFSLNNRKLNEIDLLKIKSALQILQQFKDLPQMQDLNDLILKMEWQLEKNQLFVNDIILFEQKTPAKGSEWLKLLYECVLHKTVVKLDYQPFPFDTPDQIRWAENKGSVIIHPYFIKEYKNLWYLFGFNHDKKQIENYALDRIIHIEPMINLFYRENIFINVTSHFNDIIGVTKWPHHPTEVFIVKVDAIIAPYWINRPLHHSQIIVEQTPQYVIFQLTLRWNYEWQNLILSYGAHLTVLQPIWFKNNIHAIHQQAAAQNT